MRKATSITVLTVLLALAALPLMAMAQEPAHACCPEDAPPMPQVSCCTASSQPEVAFAAAKVDTPSAGEPGRDASPQPLAVTETAATPPESASPPCFHGCKPSLRI